MPTYATREEFDARVGVLEREVEGERLVTRHILEQTRCNGDDLATIKKQLDGVDLKGLVQKVGIIDAKLTGLVNSLPTMIADALRKDRRDRRKRT